MGELKRGAASSPSRGEIMGTRRETLKINSVLCTFLTLRVVCSRGKMGDFDTVAFSSPGRTFDGSTPGKSFV